MDVTWGATCYFVPTRGTDMKTFDNKNGKDLNTIRTMTTRNDKGHAQKGRRNEREPFNPSPRVSGVGVIRTLPKGLMLRSYSCPELKLSFSKTRGLDDRDKCKTTEVDSPTPCTTEAKTMEKESRIDGNYEVFVVEGSPSPEAVGESKKRREREPCSINMTWEELDETVEESAMSSGLRQLMQRIENMAGDLSYYTKRNVDTTAKIKKLAKEIDIMSQNLSRKLNKYCTTVGRKLRKSSDKKKGPATQMASLRTQDAATQTDPPFRKQQRREDGKKVTEAATDEEIVDAVNKKWQEEWYEATTIKVGNPWNSLGEEDFAILLSECEAGMETGIARLLRDRFPELVRIESTGCLRVINTVRVGVEDPVVRCRTIYKVNLCGTTDAEILTALKSLKSLVSEGNRVVAIPIPTGADEEKFRKLVELVFRNDKIRALIHVPQRKGGEIRTAPTQRPSTVETKRNRRDKNTEVLLVKQGERSYKEMVKGLRTMVGVNQEVKALKQVRKTQDGRLLLAFKKGEPEIEEIRKQLKANWEGVEVCHGGRRDFAKCTLHIKGLDEAVEDEEIREAVRKVAPNLEAVEIGPRRPMYGGNLAVTVKVVGQNLNQLRRRNKIRIGFNMCTMDERLDLTKCFRCWEFGHIAKNCQGPDRRSLCSGCGQEGHLVAACKNEPHCLLCDTHGHRGGSGNCPKFKEALAEKRAVREKVALLPLN